MIGINEWQIIDNCEGIIEEVDMLRWLDRPITPRVANRIDLEE